MKRLAKLVCSAIQGFEAIANVSPTANDTKKAAFLRAIEDKDETDDFDLFEEHQEQADSVPDSQDDATQAADANLPANPLKRKAPENSEQLGGKENVAPMGNRRRTGEPHAKRPATLAEIREAVSFLVDEPFVPDSQVSGSEAGSDHEEAYEDEDLDEYSMGSRRKVSSTTVLGNARASVVNRLSIVRAHEEQGTDRPQAFLTGTSNSWSGFKVPALLRRASTNLSTASSTSSGATTPADTGIRRGGSKRSNIHYQAREAERKKIVEASERRRKDQVKKAVIGKGRQSVLGVLGSKGMGFE